MFIHNINPVFLSFGPIEIRYYGIVYFLGFLLTLLYLKKSKLGKKTFNSKEYPEDFIFYLILGSLITARLFYIVFYNFGFYISNPVEIIKFWHGGMSIHGGILGAMIAVYYFSKKHNYKFLELADILMIPLAISLIFGRIANFINGELYGRITSVPWAVKFPDSDGFRHPSQLYESLKNSLILIVLYFKSKNFKTGELFALFLILYSALRFAVEFVREPEIVIGFLTMGQILSIPMFVAGIWIYKTVQQKS
ncbi:MAG: prolipoprotein diacylglyceryl transferase [Nanoarchaeota archaeon]|nr:prolipoprotein diacylglyceryl transferase [Nanoarchaeota archaeon]